MTILADTYEGKRLNSPNDLAYKSDGALYFTDPPYGLPTQSEKDPQRQLDVNGVYRIPGALSQAAGSPPPTREAEFTAIPYYAWANREPGPMQVWIPRQR